MAPNKRWYLWPFLIGIGMALFPVHNMSLTQTATSNGEVLFFIPAFGAFLWIAGSGAYLAKFATKLDLGPRHIYIPLLVIVSAIGISGLAFDNLKDGISPLLAGLSLFMVYLAARELGKAIFLPLAIGAVIASLGVIVHAFVYPGELTGGYVFDYNYDIVVGYILLGAALYIGKWRWQLATLSLVAIYFTGSPEGLFAVGVLGIAVLWRRDCGKRLVIAGALIVIVAGVWTAVGHGVTLYTYVGQVFRNDASIPAEEQVRPIAGSTAIMYRLKIIGQEMKELTPLGDGYMLTAFKPNTVHNVPLVVVHQLGWPGILAALAWLWITGYCLIKTRWKYAWLLILALSVFDHFIWTQMAPVWWAMVGVSISTHIDNDKVFRSINSGL